MVPDNINEQAFFELRGTNKKATFCLFHTNYFSEQIYSQNTTINDITLKR